eukprot:676245-Pelagomonas_calceolata.AAC.1
MSLPKVAASFRGQACRLCTWPAVVVIGVELQLQRMTWHKAVDKRVRCPLCNKCMPPALQVIEVELQLPLQRMTWHEAMDRYGSDKPDLRYGLEHVDVSAYVKDCGFK